MFNLFKLFKKKPKKQYKLSEFSFRRVHKGRTQVYHTNSKEWLTWHLIVDDVFDAAGEHVTETDLHHALIDTTGNVTQGIVHKGLDHMPNHYFVGCDLAKPDDTSRTIETTASHTPSASSSSWSSGYDSGSSSSSSSFSSSSYDSGSSSSSSSSSCD
ncbi:hypothetical protein [Pseudoalteromonas caenipelagi]|uniref:hypothetical protein n=1 Tax=Pseudoalteromonas caenipelagi TaxID=2726988 RepID=UPI001C10B8E2|nr:hypothetical protein [Pseudoalteromonas caenipelagi]